LDELGVGRRREVGDLARLAEAERFLLARVRVAAGRLLLFVRRRVFARGAGLRFAIFMSFRNLDSLTISVVLSVAYRNSE
jgi:hypothetical protein